MSKKIYTCPDCNVQVKGLAAHRARMHPDTAKPTPKPKGKTLEIKPPPKKEELGPRAADKGYHCVDCGGALSKGQTPCPACGARLNWGGL